MAVDGVDGAHRCHAVDPPASLERERQTQLCLSAAHERCERYLAHRGRGEHTGIGGIAFGDGLRSTRMLLTPEPAWRGMTGRARRSSRGVVVVGAVAALGIAGGAMAATGMLDPAGVSAEPTLLDATTASPAPTERPTPSPVPSPEATEIPTATPVPTTAPTPLPTAAPTAVPTPQRTYTVQSGDTLAVIAQQFGVSVAAIQAANGIEDPNEIVIGDVLVIP